MQYQTSMLSCLTIKVVKNDINRFIWVQITSVFLLPCWTILQNMASNRKRKVQEDRYAVVYIQNFEQKKTRVGISHIYLLHINT